MTVTETTQVEPAASEPPTRLRPLPPATAVAVPPQVLTTGGVRGVALTSPAGYASANETPDSALLAFGFEIVNVSSDAPSVTIGLVPNAFAIVGGRIAVTEATADPPGPVLIPLSVDETKPLTLVCGPGVVTTTLTLAVHEPDAGIVAPADWPKSSVVAPGAGAHDGEPPHVVAAAGNGATCTPEGRASANLTPVSGDALGFESVNCSVDVPPTATGSGEKLFVSVSGCAVWQPPILTLSAKRSALTPLLPAL